ADDGPDGSAAPRTFVDEVRREQRADAVADAGNEPDQRVESEPLARAGNGERLVEPPRETSQAVVGHALSPLRANGRSTPCRAANAATHRGTSARAELCAARAPRDNARAARPR